jgi:hypothetical protein
MACEKKNNPSGKNKLGEKIGVDPDRVATQFFERGHIFR